MTSRLRTFTASRGPIPWLSAPATWAAPLVAALIVFGWSSILGGVSAEPYSDGVLARAGVGLQYGLPVVAGAAAWASRRSRALTPPAAMRALPRSALRVMVAHLWPLCAAACVGYLASALLMVTEFTIIRAFTLAIPAVYFAMVIANLSFGWVLGGYFPIPLAVPLAVLLAYQWAAYPLALANNLSLRNITGYATFMCCDFVENRLDLRALGAPVIIATALFIIALASVRLESRKLAVPALILLLGATSGAIGVAHGTSAMASTLRPQGDQVCTGVAPRVCLYPEVAPARRDFIAQTLAQATAAASRHGVELPQAVEAPARDNSADALVLHASSHATREELVTSVAASFTGDMRCTDSSSSANPGTSLPGNEVPEETVVTYALAVLLGADVDAALPTFEIMPLGEDDPTAQRPSPSRVRSMLGVHDADEAVALATRWYAAQLECEG